MCRSVDQRRRHHPSRQPRGGADASRGRPDSKHFDGNVWRDERDKAKLYETPEVAYAVRRKLGLDKTTILSTLGAEIAELAVETCPSCGQARVR
jgi:hypothetical protein